MEMMSRVGYDLKVLHGSSHTGSVVESTTGEGATACGWWAGKKKSRIECVETFDPG